MQRQANDMASAIESLLLDDNGIEKIAVHLGGFNIFEAIGHTRSEERHSDFLAFLLDPNETHGIGTEFLTRFVVEIVKSMRPESRPLSLSEITLADFEGCLVLREYHQIDVLCIDEAQRFLLAIENKVGSGERSGQLKRYRSFLEKHYRGCHRILAYLTPDNDEASDENWAPVGYSTVLSVVETLVGKHRESLGETVAMALDHYARMLRRHIVTDNELVDIARAVYRKHKAALDFIFEHRPDNQLDISEFVADLFSKDGRVEVVRRSKTYINFFPKSWKGIRAFNATSTDQWTKTGHSLLFEVRNSVDSIKMAIVIGPTAENGLRKDILDFSHGHPRLFPNASNSLSPNYTQIYSKTMIHKAMLHKQPIEDVKHKLESELKTFMDKEFESIVDVLAEAFTQAGPN